MPGRDFEYVVILTTAGSDEQAVSLARELVERRLAACVNILHGVCSVFRWDGRIQEDRESLLVVKTRAEMQERVTAAIRELHSYEVPEVVVLPVIGGSEPYLAWLEGETRDRDGHMPPSPG